jgi:hypothetical protein
MQNDLFLTWRLTRRIKIKDWNEIWILSNEREN